MFKALSLAALALAAPVLLLRERGADDDVDKMAREVATKFMSAMKTESIERVMELVSVPYWEFGVVITDREVIAENHREVFEKEDLGGVKFELTAVHAYPEARERFSELDRELLKRVMADGDRVVQFTVEQDGETNDDFTVFVRLRNGTASVAGVEFFR
jgi:hypothetical protein